jgi:hypothetical protein
MYEKLVSQELRRWLDRIAGEAPGTSYAEAGQCLTFGGLLKLAEATQVSAAPPHVLPDGRPCERCARSLEMFRREVASLDAELAEAPAAAAPELKSSGHVVASQVSVLLQSVVDSLVSAPSRLVDELGDWALHLAGRLTGRGEGAAPSGRRAVADLARSDAAYCLSLGPGSAAQPVRPDTVPFVVTALRAAPERVSVRVSHPPGEYSLVVHDLFGEEVGRAACDQPAPPWPENVTLEAGLRYEWEVRQGGALNHPGELMVRGLVRLLTDEELRSLEQAEAAIRDRRAPDEARAVSLAALHVERGLYEEAIAGMRRLTESVPTRAGAVIAHRTLASLYRAAAAEIPGWLLEASWLRALANEALLRACQELLTSDEEAAEGGS